MGELACAYVEPCTVDDKFETDNSSKPIDEPIKEDEAPTVVILPNSEGITHSDIDIVKMQILKCNAKVFMTIHYKSPPLEANFMRGQ